MGKGKVTLNQVEESQTFDEQTGELLGRETKVRTFVVEKEPQYVKLYTQDIGRIYGLKNSQNRVLMALAKYMAFNTNIIVLYGPVKDMLCKELGMNKNTFNMAIDQLYKQGFLIRKARACYVLDPCLFGTGSWQDVKNVRLSIEYHADGTKTIRTELDKGNGKLTFGRGLEKVNENVQAEEVKELPFPETQDPDE